MNQIKLLVTVREHRKKAAERDLARASLAAIEAAARLTECQQRLKIHIEITVQREQMLFRDLCSRIVQLPDIEDTRSAIAMMREAQRMLKVEVEQVEAAHQSAMQTLAVARKNAWLVTNKFSQLDDLRHARDMQLRIEEQLREEAEADDSYRLPTTNEFHKGAVS